MSELPRNFLVEKEIHAETAAPGMPALVTRSGELGSRASALPMAAFYVALDHPWVLNTWDHLMIPKPFSKALVRVSAKMQVPSDAADETMNSFHGQLQSALDRVTSFAEANVRLVGSPDFPLLPKAQSREPNSD